MEKISVYAYKYSGKCYRLWKNGDKLLETKDYIIIKQPIGTEVNEVNGHAWNTRYGSICYFSKNHWFNIIYVNQEKRPYYYCNVAFPIVSEQNSLKYIDFDLDVRYYPDSKESELLDEDEYLVHKEKYQYSSWIRKKISEELFILQYWISNEIGPFSKIFLNEWLHEIK